MITAYISRIERRKSDHSTLTENVRNWYFCGDGQGSGNTANIGCNIDIDDLKKENGIFSNLSEELFDEYWQNYGVVSHKGKKITNLKSYLEFKGKPNLWKKVTTKILRNNK